MRSLVAIVGRPNVGKSTLFNRLVGRRLAIVEDQPGATRDRHYADVALEDRPITLIDTGGFVPGEADALLQQVREQAQLAVEEGDITLFVVDGRAGLTAADEAVATYLRKSGKPVLLVVNKLDSQGQEDTSQLPEFYRLGFETVIGVSAEHGRNFGELREELAKRLPEPAPETGAPAAESDVIRIAIIGRPNVGKSTLVNALLRKKRVIASPEPGTTRDPIDSEITFKGRKVILTDTAGIRRKKTISQRLEQYAVMGALRTVERSEVVVLVLDATEPAVDQEAKLAGLSDEKGRALIILVNKWDKVQSDVAHKRDFEITLAHRFKFVAYAPVLYGSALTGAKVDQVMHQAVRLHNQYVFKASTPQLNRLLETIIANHPAPFAGGKPLRIYYAAQVAAAPPTFVFTCNRPAGIPDRYKRFLMNSLREAFQLQVPIRLLFRERPGKEKRASRRIAPSEWARKAKRRRRSQ